LNLNESNKQSAQNLKKAFENWENPSPPDSLWNKLDNSLTEEFNKNHSVSEAPHSLEAAFFDWDADVPGDALWSKLDADLSTESVWNKLDKSLDSAENPDAWLTAAYSEWSTGTNNDGWNKLDEALSRERVWTRLNSSLSKPIATSSSWLKYAASLTTFFFLSFFMNDESTEHAVIVSDNSGIVDTENPLIDPAIEPAASTNLNPTNGITVAQRTPTENNNAGNPEKQHTDLAPNNSNNQLPVNNELSVVENQENTFGEQFEVNSLGKKMNDFACHDDIIRQLVPKVQYANWTVSLGTQLSFLDESTRDQISTVTPRLGLTGELAFNKHFNHWGITQSAGFSQFAQTNGNYVNGRYLNSQQQLRVLQFNTSLFYSIKRFDLNGGLVFTRLLSGDEQQNSKIVNVYYMTNSIQAGLTGGISYNLTPSATRMKFGIGAQYQWIPQISAGNSTFHDIQGFKLLGKISF
jgi:hypothetical protein